MTATTELTPHDLLIRGVRVRYFEAGSGPPLVLIHGFLVNHKEWALVIPGLAKHFRVIAPDLPGFGESERPAEFRYEREGYAEVVRDLIAGLDIPRAHIAGHSMGGAIALGHPLGATGAVRTATIVHGLRRRQQKYGMVTMCIGTGMGAAGIFEAL